MLARQHCRNLERTRTEKSHIPYGLRHSCSEINEFRVMHKNFFFARIRWKSKHLLKNKLNEEQMNNTIQGAAACRGIYPTALRLVQLLNTPKRSKNREGSPLDTLPHFVQCSYSLIFVTIHQKWGFIFLQRHTFQERWALLHVTYVRTNLIYPVQQVVQGKATKRIIMGHCPP